MAFHALQKASDLADMITRVIQEGLEGLVLKDIKASSHSPCTAVSWELGNDSRQSQLRDRITH